MFDSTLLVLLGLSTATFAAQPSAPKPIPAPLRNLTWGQLNFLHTTDTHGWLAGHLREPSYSADWGDYVSFATRMREKAADYGVDLLVIDTGDRIEGNGLYDSSEPKGRYTADIFKRQHIDVLSSGNHELYKRNSSEDEFLVTVPNFSGNYLASNIDIVDPNSGDLVPLAPRFKKFTTDKQGIRIVAFGFLFDFKGNYNNTVVQPVEDTVKEEWFQEAIRDSKVDLFLVAGHVPVQSREYQAIFKAIRAVQWDVPIQFFGGHYHIRDYARYDATAYGLASGRFMETIGFMSISGLSTGGKAKNKPHQSSAAPVFNRKYIDNNLFSFYHHTGLNETTFPTEAGNEVSDMIRRARHDLKLDSVYGCAPDNLWMSRAKYPSKHSIYTWLEERVIPETLYESKRSAHPALTIVNTGGIRFDIFEGPFTQDTAFILSPFISGFKYIKDVPYEKATKMLEVLNKQPQILSQNLPIRRSQTSFLSPPEQQAISRDIVVEDDRQVVTYSNQDPLSGEPTSPDPVLMPGYTTNDDGGSDGDDTVHSPINFYRVPNCIQASVPAYEPSIGAEGSSLGPKPDVVDLAYIDFIEPWIDVAAKFVGLDLDVDRDTDVYMEGSTLLALIIQWVEKNWKCEEA